LTEITARFGTGSPKREAATAVLRRVHELVKNTGKLDRFVIFGSYVTAKMEPNDADVVFVMKNDFVLAACEGETRDLFDHQRAAQIFGASIFWVRPSMLILETVEEFIAHWQIKRDLSRRGIVEVIE
jgi:hypothetical protein